MTMDATFDFGDGNGPVPASKHPNGGGWVAKTAFVSSSAYVACYCFVYGNARVSGNAWVSGTAWVSGDSRVSGTAWVSGNARVSGDSRVSGNARVSGNEISTRTPKHLLGFPYGVTVTDHHIRAGCESHPLSVWKSRGAAIIRKEGFTSEEARQWNAIIVAIGEAHGCTEPATAEEAA